MGGGQDCNNLFNHYLVEYCAPIFFSFPDSIRREIPCDAKVCSLDPESSEFILYFPWTWTAVSFVSEAGMTTCFGIFQMAPLASDQFGGLHWTPDPDFVRTAPQQPAIPHGPGPGKQMALRTIVI